MRETLSSICKNFLQKLDSIETANNLKYLILDDKTRELIYSFIDEKSLLRHVTAIEMIHERRKPQQSIEAVYLIEPSQFSINCLLADFSKHSRYKKAHLLTTRELQKFQQSLCRDNPNLRERLTRSEVVRLSFIPVESNVFITNSVDSMQVYFNRECHSLVSNLVQRSIDALINFCIITKEYPIVRYYSPESPVNGTSELCKHIARNFQKQLDDFIRRDDSFTTEQNPRARSVLIITDRTLDLFAPLLHEFTYQAMAMDLADFPKDKYGKPESRYTYEAENEKNEKETKTSVLNYQDPLWCSLAHWHIVKVSDILVEKVNELISKNPLMYDRSNAATSTDLLYIVAHLKDFDEERRRITLHKKLSDYLMTLNGTKKTLECGTLEQNLAANGTTAEGEKCKNLALQVVEALSQECYSDIDKIRLIVVYALFRGGIIQADVMKLVQFAKLDGNRVMDLFANYELLDFLLLKPTLKTKRFKKQPFHTIDNDAELVGLRFKPAIEKVVESSLNQTLDEQVFPYTKDKPLENDDSSTTSLRNPRHRAAWAKRNQSYIAPRQRVIYFVVGGMTYSEMRSVYQLSRKLNKDVVIGSDEIITPREFVTGAMNLNRARQKLNLVYDRKVPTEAPAHLFQWDEPKREEPKKDFKKVEPISPPKPKVEEKKKVKKSDKLKRLFKK